MQPGGKDEEGISMIRVTVYNEGVHELTSEAVRAAYPEGIDGQLKNFLTCEDVTVRCFTLATVNEITEDVLNETDVMLWWGHMAHDKVPDEVVARVCKAVRDGMGMIFLHSAHHSKPFRALMGTTCDLTWREDGDYERVWTVNPGHPIAQGIGRYFMVDNDETYGEPFCIPEPDEVIFIGSYEGGEVFRSGCTFHRELGRIFYFQPGHETFPVYFNKDVQTVIRNAVRWAAPVYRRYRSNELMCPNVKKPADDPSKAFWF